MPMFVGVLPVAAEVERVGKYASLPEGMTPNLVDAQIPRSTQSGVLWL
jgi:hypothetical protein